MSGALAAQPIISEAEKRERSYDWLGAAESYKKALDVVSVDDFSEQGKILERSGYAFYRAAMQSETRDEFRHMMLRAIEDYLLSSQISAKIPELPEKGRNLRCQAMECYLRSWLTSEPSEKKKYLDESWTLTKGALMEFQNAGDLLEHGRTYNLLATSAFHRHFLDTDFDSVQKTAREAAEEGERAIVSLSAVGDKQELATACINTSADFSVLSGLVSNMDVRESYYPKARNYWRIANENSEQAVLLAISSPEGALGAFIEDPKERRQFLEKALDYCRGTKDRLHVGTISDVLASETYWEALSIEDPEERLELAEKARRYGEDAERQYSVIGYTSSRLTAWPGPPYVEYYCSMALWETDLVKRRELLEKAWEAAPELLQWAESSGYSVNRTSAHHVVSKVLESLAKVEQNPMAKKEFLENALSHRNESIREISPLERFAFWDQGVYQNYLAEIRSELAELTKDPEVKMNTLSEAVAAKRTGVELCLKDLQSWEKMGPMPGQRAVLGRYQREHGNLLARLHKVIGKRTILEETVRTFENAAESFQIAGLASSMAECYWKCALAYDSLDQQMESGEKFVIASDCYKKAAEKIPQLKIFYDDYASYMKGWSEIEKARHHHSKQEYGLAMECYEKAASLHKLTRKWGYLAANYQAWSHVEKAEDLSRREHNKEAVEAFEQADGLFNEAKNSLQKELVKIESLDESEMTTRLVKAADLRAEYCKARIVLEEAVILDKRGDHNSSSEKHGLAASAFEKLVEAVKSEQDKREIGLIMTLARAWQMMTKAEAEESPPFYRKASELFEEAMQLCTNERTRSLILGHSRFCRALEAGARYADTREPTLHTSAIQHLESASNYYLRAGFENASEYAKASRLLFDAYSFMDEAGREGDQEKKARIYAMAEKVLQASAESYSKAEHLDKKDQAEKLLERVREGRKLAVSLTQVFQAPSELSTTAAFATPTPTHEAPVGLDKFEHADIQASMIARQTSLRVGDELALEIELVNTGKGTAQLIKLEELIPHGFELTQKPEHYRVEYGYLNLKGKQLASLKTEELNLVLKPKVHGRFTLKPRVLYLDDNGKYKSHELEPITITVKELGISGWLRGR